MSRGRGRARPLALAALLVLGACGGHRPPHGTERPRGHSLEGLASWYGPGFHGRQTASGETYDARDLTAAHRTLPFATRVLVRNLDNGRTCWVRINDRGPFVAGRVIDLSYSAAMALDLVGPGTARVRLEVLPVASAARPGSSPPASMAMPPPASEVAAFSQPREPDPAVGGWSVQVGAFALAENAERLARRLTRRGVQAEVLEQGDLARVRVTGFDGEEPAALFAETLRRDGFEAIVVRP